MTVSLASIRDALEGVAPAVIATAAADGTPNLSYLSDVQYVDERHVALSFQFFNKTRANVLANPFARVLIIHGASAQLYRMLVQYLRTETEGPLFERMRARLAGIASHEGMANVFKLRGSDIYRVLAIEPVPGSVLPVPPQPNPLAPLRSAMGALLRANDLDVAFDDTLDALVRDFDIPHAMLLVRDPATQRLVTVASRGYDTTGVGAEVAEGDGVIGVAVQEGVPIRINHALAEHAYVNAVREQSLQGGVDSFEPPIPRPGLAAPGSQMALPVSDGTRVIAVLYVEHPQAQRFGYDLEDALAAVADGLGMAMRRLEQQAASAEAPGADCGPALPAPAEGGQPIRVRLEPRTDSVFVDDEYLIRGVAGAVLWKMLCEHLERGRSEFSSRELRADPALSLPEIGDNLAARLILLQRRLDERRCGIRLYKCGRGRVALALERPLRLDSLDAVA